MISYFILLVPYVRTGAGTPVLPRRVSVMMCGEMSAEGRRVRIQPTLPPHAQIARAALRRNVPKHTPTRIHHAQGQGSAAAQTVRTLTTIRAAIVIRVLARTSGAHALREFVPRPGRRKPALAADGMTGPVLIVIRASEREKETSVSPATAAARRARERKPKTVHPAVRPVSIVRIAIRRVKYATPTRRAQAAPPPAAQRHTTSPAPHRIPVRTPQRAGASVPPPTLLLRKPAQQPTTMSAVPVSSVPDQGAGYARMTARVVPERWSVPAISALQTPLVVKRRR